MKNVIGGNMVAKSMKKLQYLVQNLSHHSIIGSAFHTNSHYVPKSDKYHENLRQYHMDTAQYDRPKGKENFAENWTNKLDFSLHIEESIKRGEPIPRISLDNIGVMSILGRRKENQDRVKVAEINENLLYFGMYDGHGGTVAVDFVAQQMQEQIENSLKQTTDLQHVLRESFIQVNNRLTDYIIHNHKEEDAMHCGTTATVALLRNSVELVIGHVGDSRAILSRKASAIRLTKDHDPDTEQEARRIETSGGSIMMDSLGRPMVNGILAMTRSIGDLNLKPYGVTAIPDTRSVGVRHSKDGFLVLVSDGITFIMNDQEILNTISVCTTPREAVTLLTDLAMQFGTDDNCSCIIIPFGAWGKYAENAIPFSFSRTGTTRNL